MSLLQKIGLTLFLCALAIFTLTLGLNKFTLTSESLAVDKEVHRESIISMARDMGMLDKTYQNQFAFVSDLKKCIKASQLELSASYDNAEYKGSEWDYKIGDWAIKDYILPTVQKSGHGMVSDNKGLFLLLTFGLGILGGLIFILPKFMEQPGIKNDNIYHDPLTRGMNYNIRTGLLITSIIGILVYGIFYTSGNVLLPILSAIVILIIIGLVFIYQKEKNRKSPRSASAKVIGWLGLVAGIYLIIFYILLYWKPEYITNWMTIVDPVSEKLNGGAASQWFLYGLMYTVIVLVMGVRMISKYRHNRYQIIRTLSVMFFQTAIAFLLPEILTRLNYPYYDFKNIWPLNYTFFFDWNIKNLIASGGLGIFMLVWGIVLIVLAVPIITYFFGKRWYCSWVCGCGGLAETMGDPFRQLSDKSVRAWRFERWIIHAVLVFAVVMTLMVLYHYFTGRQQVLFLNSDSIRSWYGFLIGSAFAGVVGTGFYPLMGNRVWCRYGCPLAAYLGLVQRFKSRFRITTNGGQCISCGNCSTYCEMGIDVRHYAQRGQDIVRSSCVGCGVCAAVCPRGVLRLENASADVNQRTEDLRTVHIEDLINAQ